jgi:hypothetical protein
VAAPRQVVGLMKNCRDVLDEVPDNRKVLMAPGPRYLRCKCCDKQGHVTNFEDRGYRKEITCDLQEAKEALVDLCRECEMRNYKQGWAKLVSNLTFSKRKPIVYSKTNVFKA